MHNLTRRLDPGSIVVIGITFVLFFVALFLKGFSKEMLLEAAVFLVSVKLIMAAYRSREMEDVLLGRLREIQEALQRIEAREAGPQP